MYKLLSILTAITLLASAALAEEHEEPARQTIYVSMHPHFLTNLSNGRFVSIKAQAMVSDVATQEALKLHMPAVRHEILMLLSDMRADQLRTVAQKEELRQKALQIMLETLQQRAAGAEAVEGFFITSMVIQ